MSLHASADRDPGVGFQPRPAARIADRYELLRELGRGGHGEVWEARDTLAGEVVAVKFLRAGSATDPARARREISTLRLLRLPGVARLFDEGTEEGCPFLVMELVAGLPFPGVALPVAWPAMAGTTVAVLETLARIHAAAIVHRDLKPENVLVGADGRPTILDFGLSSGRLSGEDDAPAGYIEGTFPYLAPEQLRGEAVSPQTDLYALGVLLYEALAGRLPHHAGSLQALMIARLTERPEPLARIAPGVPEEVSALVERMLALEPEDRPRSAAEALGILRGQKAAQRTTLPRLGGEGPVRALVDAGRTNQFAYLVGEPGTGRSRALAEAVEALSREGRTVLRAPPSPRPYESLAPVIGPLPREGALGAVSSWVDERLRSLLAAGVVLAVDDVEELDRWSREAIERARGWGAILVTGQDPWRDFEEIPLRLLDEGDLRPLFAGPERLFHLQTDAARVLDARTGGVAARVVNELEGWTRAGLARWDGAAFVVDRGALDQLEAMPPEPSPPSLDKPPPIPPHLEELVACIELGLPEYPPLEVAAAIGNLPWAAEALVAELMDLAPWGHPRGENAFLLHLGLAPRLPTARVRAIHRALAARRAPGTEGRLLRLLRAAEGGSIDECIEITLEAEASGRRAAEEGRLGRAVTAIREGLLFVRQSPFAQDPRATSREQALLVSWAEVALSEGTPSALDRILYELCRTRPRTEDVAHLEALVRAALALAAGADRAFAMADAVAPFAEVRLEAWRQRLRIASARRGPNAPERRLEVVLCEVESWATSTGEPSARLVLDAGLARKAYQDGHFEDAARLHLRVAEAEPFLASRIAALDNAASARMETFRFDEAAAYATEARDLAQRCRHAHLEARAEWLLRAVGYRACRVHAPDRELLDAVERLGVPDLEGLVCMNEGAVAFRGGDRDFARALAERATRIWTGMGKRWASLLAQSLAIACGRRVGEGEARDLATQIAACPVPGLGIQMLGMLGLVRQDVRDRFRASLPELCAGVPPAFWSMRMEVLSVDEARAAIEGDQGSAGGASR
ncbi:serine/threonine-protein kinase [Polyangium sp. 6x1]|uniref:serine/threonine-protein kinase n=1 Tax=Polyangium sp. 6x1 TaxID=3042689 RepID=UPI0024825CE4|nr:serine/threonine-protein kinase [Polyangium sp. 6x1]MDI1447782.1 serine/threonine-protein kinase [Polyangium sp. 6x1]